MKIKKITIIIIAILLAGSTYLIFKNYVNKFVTTADNNVEIQTMEYKDHYGYQCETDCVAGTPCFDPNTGIQDASKCANVPVEL